MLGQELIIACIVQCASFCIVVATPGPAISFGHKVLCFLARLFVFLVL